jgi:hypothetical protein
MNLFGVQACPHVRDCISIRVLQEVIEGGGMEEDALQELLFERLGLVLLPPGAGHQARPGGRVNDASRDAATLPQFIERMRGLLALEEAAEVEQAEAELSSFSPAGAQVRMHVVCVGGVCGRPRRACMWCAWAGACGRPRSDRPRTHRVLMRRCINTLQCSHGRCLALASRAGAQEDVCMHAGGRVHACRPQVARCWACAAMKPRQGSSARRC